VLVNNPGTWANIYDPLEHAAWHGLTPTDYIFPFFLFIVGIAIPIALSKRLDTGVNQGVYLKIISRSAMIFGLGLVMSIIPFFSYSTTDIPEFGKMGIWLVFTAGLLFLLLRSFRVAGILFGIGALALVALYLTGYTIAPYNFGTMRIFGVLQRIAICYLIVAVIFLHINWKQQLGLAIALLLGYWVLMTQISVPGCEVTTIDDKACNLAAYLDRLILGENHIWRGGKVYDPEGILSTIPAIATTISGVLTGTWLLKSSPPFEGGVAAASADGLGLSDAPKDIVTEEKNPVATAPGSDPSDQAFRLNKVAGLFFFGVVCVAIGWVWNIYFPFNKSLWTSSYVIVTTGLALCFLAFCYWLIDIKGYRKWTKPFVIFGVNALALFVFSGIFARMLGAFKITSADGQPIVGQKWIYENVFLRLAQPIDASLMYALAFILFWLFLMWLLYRTKTFIKV